MLDWKCGKCSKEYSTSNLLKLEQIKIVENDTNPKENYGFTSKCTCGYRFNLDKWKQFTIVRPRGKFFRVRVSSVFLELNHGFGDRPLYYETMIFYHGLVLESWADINSWRYATQEKCEEHHVEIVRGIKNGTLKCDVSMLQKWRNEFNLQRLLKRTGKLL